MPGCYWWWHCPSREGISAEDLCREAAQLYPCDGDDCIAVFCSDWINSGTSDGSPMVCSETNDLAQVLVSPEFLDGFNEVCGDRGFEKSEMCSTGDTAEDDWWVVACQVSSGHCR